jgi:hypothetical protein
LRLRDFAVKFINREDAKSPRKTQRSSLDENGTNFTLIKDKKLFLSEINPIFASS